MRFSPKSPKGNHGERPSPKSRVSAPGRSLFFAKSTAPSTNALAAAAQPSDQAARDKIAERAELLNPDSWVTADDVTQGLDKFEQVLAELVQQVGAPRRRTRRGGRRNRRRRDRMLAAQAGTPPEGTPPHATTPPAGASGESAEMPDDFDDPNDDFDDGEPEPTA